MQALITLLPIFGFASAFFIYGRKKSSVSIFFSITLIISVLYIFGMLEVLKFGSFFIFYAGIVLFLYFIIKHKPETTKLLTTVPSILFIVSATIYLYLMKDAHFFFWDEYSHWGPFIKEMYFYNHFYDASSVAANLSYPPGISTWDYFIVKNTFFSEGNIYFSYFLLLFGSTLMMYERVSFKDFHWIILIFSIQMIIFADFGHWFSSIYVDHIVGAVFAGIILSYICDDFKNRDIYLFIFPMLALAVIKETGFLFDIFAVGLIYLLYISKNSEDFKISFFLSIKENKKVFFMLAGLVIVVFIALQSWNIRQKSYGILNSGITINKIISNLTKKETASNREIKNKISKNFIKVLVSQQINKNKNSLNYNEFSYAIMKTYKDNIKLTTIGMFGFILLLSLLLILTDKDRYKKKTIILISVYLMVIFISHIWLLYISYLNGFGADGIRIPSYVRYANTIILPILMILFSLFMPAFQKSGTKTIAKKDNKTFFYVLIATVLLVFLAKPYLKPLYSQLNNNFSTDANKASKNILKYLPRHSKVFVVFPIRNNGSLNNILKYTLIPAHATISSKNFSLKTPQEMFSTYSKYNYVWFATFDKNIISKNRKILKARSKNSVFTLYKVEKNGKNLKFTPVI